MSPVSVDLAAFICHVPNGPSAHPVVTTNGSRTNSRTPRECARFRLKPSLKRLPKGCHNVCTTLETNVILRTMEDRPDIAQATREELERVLSSPEFARTERLSRLLRFLVGQHLEGRQGDLRESTIAVEVFGRRPDYDPKQDSTVRTEASRLRARTPRCTSNSFVGMPGSSPAPLVRTLAAITIVPAV